MKNAKTSHDSVKRNVDWNLRDKKSSSDLPGTHRTFSMENIHNDFIPTSMAEDSSLLASRKDDLHEAHDCRALSSEHFLVADVKT
jgi:hypothetical protein